MNAIRLALLPLMAALMFASCGVKPGVDNVKAPDPATLDFSKNPRIGPGVQAIRDSRFTDACRILQPIVDESPTDIIARAALAIAQLGAGRNEQARRQMSVALSWSPNYVEGYTVRAVAAARMGGVEQAKHSLEIARRLDPADKLKLRAVAEEQVKAALGVMPKETPARLHGALLEAARSDEPLEKLIERALVLQQAANATRKYGDETYAESTRRLIWDMLSHRNDPDRMAAYAHFLIDEIDPRGDAVVPTKQQRFYREKNKALQDLELQAARQMLEAALRLNPNHVSTLAGLARIEFRAQMWANAEGYLRRAVATGQANPTVLVMMRDIMQIAAGQNMARSIQLRTARRWEEKIGGYIYEYTSYPSAAELARADAHDAQASNLLYQSKAYLADAVRKLSNDATSRDFAGCMAYRVKDWDTARKAWEQAMSMDPDERQYRYSLANAYARLNLIDQYLDTANTGRNMEHTTAATHLQWSWGLITSGNWSAAAALIRKAIEIDPCDARSVAFLAVIAEAQENKSEALAMYRAALAIDEAHARQRGCSWLTGSGYWFVNDIIRAQELRARIAELSAEKDPSLAADYCVANVKLESMINDSALKEVAYEAMLPLPNLAANLRQDAPSFGELMRTYRALAALYLVKAGRFAEAAPHFRLLPDYESRHRTGGGKAYNAPSDAVWLAPDILEAAALCFQKIGSRSEAEQWQMRFSQWQRRYGFRGAEAIGHRHIPTSNQPRVGGARM